MLLGLSRTAVAMCCAGVAVLVIGLAAVRRELARARGLDVIRELTNVSFAVPLGMFGALHLSGPQFVMSIVPAYMPARDFWVYFVGVALLAAALSIATKTAVRWSGVLFGIMMFSFVAMIHLPGALAQPHNRIIWMIVFREMAFGGAGLLLAGNVAVGRVLVALAMVVFGVEHFLHPTGLPGVPLVKQMPAWIPLPEVIDYVTGAALLVGAGSVVLKKHTRTVVTCVGGWILLMVLVIYLPVLLGALSNPSVTVEVEGLNYFADTLLFAGAILAIS